MNVAENKKKLTSLCDNYIKNNDYQKCVDVLFDYIKLFEKSITKDLQKIIIDCINYVFETYTDIVNGEKVQANKQIFLNNEIDKSVPKKKNIIYKIIFATDEMILKLFILFLILLNNEKKKFFVGIDYEFRKGKVALMQMNFEKIVTQNVKFIWIIDPYELNENMKHLMIKYLMINKKIYKIFQGSDSRDMEYIYPHLFQNNKTMFLQFIKNVIDTRFLCEYYKSCKNETDLKSSIYDSLIYFNVITKEKYDELLNVEIGMGPSTDVEWNIHKMSQSQKYYAFFDVLYLKYLVKRIYLKLNTEFPEYAHSLNYVNKISRFAFGESDKLQITTIRLDIEKIINPMNINYLRLKENIKMNDISKFILKDLIVPLPNKTNNVIQLNYLFRVPYFKKCLHAVFTLIIYNIVSKNYIIYKNKFDKFTDSINIDEFYEIIQKNYGKQFVEFLIEFEKSAKVKIFATYKKFNYL